MSKIIAFCASLAFLVGFSGSAGAIVVPSPLPGEPLDIDFRTGSFSGCGGLNACTGTVGTDVDVLVTAFPDTGGLFWAADDGFGVIGGFQDDEIDPFESVTVNFTDGPRLVTGAWFTDIFSDSGGAAGPEEAIVMLFLGAGPAIMTFNFFGTETGNTNNGGLFGSFGTAFSVDKLVFTSPNIIDNEYSVAGITVVPLPGALGLMVSGLAAFVVMARRRRKAAAA
jgi:hypothetical protein